MHPPPSVRTTPGLSARLAALLAALLLSAVAAQDAPAGDEGARDARALPPRDATAWRPFVEWRLSGDAAGGNPYDVEARATFVHESGAEIVTWTFWDGEGAWVLRFTPTLAGRWRVETESAAPDLDGWRGEVTAAPPDEGARGFLTAAGTTFARPRADGGFDATLWNVYEVPGETLESLADLPRDPGERERAVSGFLDEVEAAGMDALMLRLYHNWLSLGAYAYRDHDSENPDPAAFALLEEVMLAAHARGLGVHIWAWGDEQRRWTPVGLDGGINGPVDRRLQRYLAARLGPLPDWTMSYGFDLHEWVEPDQTRAWASFLEERMGWPHPLGAREVDLGPDKVFDLGADKLGYTSSDDRPFQLDVVDPYGLARLRLEEGGRPVLFERRFTHERDGVWSAEATRRALWQFAIAGGASGIWGRWDGPPYPNGAELRAFRAFFARGLETGMAPAEGLAGDARTLADEGGDTVLVYAEGADEVALDLRDLDGPRRLLALDARGDGTWRDEGVLEPGVHRWRAPGVSDWGLLLARP